MITIGMQVCREGRDDKWGIVLETRDGLVRVQWRKPSLVLWEVAGRLVTRADYDRRQVARVLVARAKARREGR